MNLARRAAMDLIRLLQRLFENREFVRSSDVQRALGISRQATWERLRPLVEVGVLIPSGSGRGTRYRPGKLHESNPSCATHSSRFWSALVEESPRLQYVPVFLAARGLQRRADARALLPPVPSSGFVVLDFDQVETVGESFARYALCEWPRSVAADVVAINASPDVRRTLARVRHLDRGIF